MKMMELKKSAMRKTILFIFCSIFLLEQSAVVSGGSILFYMPVVSRSIRITFMPVASEMARLGHEVVVVTQHPDKKPDPNLTEITIDGKIFNELTEKVSEELMKSGSSPDPPLQEFVEAQLAVSVLDLIDLIS